MAVAGQAAAQALPRKLRYVFVLQAVVAAAAVLIGAYLSSQIVLTQLAEHSLRGEAAFFWQRLQADPAHRPPNTLLLQGHFSATPEQTPDTLPMSLQPLGEGLHEVREKQLMVLVDRQPQGTLYLTYRRLSLERQLMWMALVPALIALLVIGIGSWLAYRGTRRLVRPLAWLAQQVGEWDPREPDSSRMHLDALPDDAVIEARQLALALQRMAQRMREYVRRERDFTRDASHELRTPLTVIRVAGDLASSDPDLPPRVQRSLERIQRAGSDMEAVIDAFLILARADSVEPHRETFDVHEVVYHELDKVRPLLDGRPVELRLDEQASLRLHASPRALGVMLGNVLHNACMFTEQGEIVVTLDADGVQVQDTGIGMSPDILAQATDPFYRADISRPHAKGMGLTIVQRLGQRFGWPVDIHSRPEHGTTVKIRFPDAHLADDSGMSTTA